MTKTDPNARIARENNLAYRLECVTRERDAYKRACKQAGVCMTCVLSPPDTFGCSDCLNTGWEQGDPHKQMKVVEEERNTAKAEAERLRAYVSDARFQTIQSEQEGLVGADTRPFAMIQLL